MLRVFISSGTKGYANWWQTFRVDPWFCQIQRLRNYLDAEWSPSINRSLSHTQDTESDTNSWTHLTFHMISHAPSYHSPSPPIRTSRSFLLCPYSIFSIYQGKLHDYPSESVINSWTPTIFRKYFILFFEKLFIYQTLLQ